ncbi:MAG: hypothetical protein ABI416_17950 [Ginsengibacter sp.]
MDLKKVIILAYYFPPCNLTPAERIFSFATYLNEFGYYPIVVTRNWDIPILHSRDEHKKTGDRTIHEKKENYEVYYVPFKPTLKNILFEKFYGTKFYFLYLWTAFIYTFGENFSSLFTPYLPLYRQCKKLLQENNDIAYMLISAGPFHLFKFGYKFNRKFNTSWIADYRDDWNTNNLMQHSIFKKLLRDVSGHYEKKWLSNANFFISVSDFYVKKIHAFLKNIPGYTIFNGYIETNYPTGGDVTTDQFVITYAGSLYHTQPVEIFLAAYKKFIDQAAGVPNSRVIFLGLEANPPLLAIVKKQVKGYEKYFNYTDRVAKKEAIAIQYNSTILLAIGYGNRKGIPGSKVYEYLALRKPVLICPSDHDIIEETLRSTNQAIVTNTVDECADKLRELYSEFVSAGKIAIKTNDDIILQYSRKAQVRRLAALMSKDAGNDGLVFSI